jgi:ankyrin repeat protein
MAREHRDCQRARHNDVHSAAKAGKLEYVRASLATGDCSDARDDEGKAALHHAPGPGYTIMVRYLIGRGADGGTCDDFGITPLRRLACHGHIGTVTWLLEHGAKVNRQHA